MKYYKFLTADNKGEYSKFDYTDYLPDGDKPGKWLPKIEIISLCEIGYHACKAECLLSWVNAQLFEVEFDGDIIDGDDKTVAQRMRILRKIETWNDKTARLFACWCARDVLHIFEDKCPDDVRPRVAIKIAERYAEGNATLEELDAARAAARAAAWAAARDAARDAAWAAARAAARAAAWDAAWAAAWAAARDAAWAAAWDAAWAAAWAAARDAAWAAARDAARDAAWAAAWAAARAAARAAASAKYTKHLIEILGLAVVR